MHAIIDQWGSLRRLARHVVPVWADIGQGGRRWRRHGGSLIVLICHKRLIPFRIVILGIALIRLDSISVRGFGVFVVDVECRRRSGLTLLAIFVLFDGFAIVPCARVLWVSINKFGGVSRRAGSEMLGNHQCPHGRLCPVASFESCDESSERVCESLGNGERCYSLIELLLHKSGHGIIGVVIIYHQSESSLQMRARHHSLVYAALLTSF